VSHHVREIEWNSIRKFVESFPFRGRTLDFGCGRQPYAEHVISCGSVYIPYDRVRLPGSTVNVDVGRDDPLGEEWDTILCTQVMQYVPHPYMLLDRFYAALRHNGVVVMTYPTCWDEVENDDLHRFTKAGMTRLLYDAGFLVERHERRATVTVEGFNFPLGYGVVARRMS